MFEKIKELMIGNMSKGNRKVYIACCGNHIRDRGAHSFAGSFDDRVWKHPISGAYHI